MNRNRKVQNKAKNRDAVELHLGPMKTEQVSTLDVSDENIEFLSPEDPEAQKILKFTSDEITYLLDDDGNYYFHTSDADEDIEEIQKEVIQIKSERLEANEGGTKIETSSVLEKVKLNLAKTQTQRKIKPKPSSSSAVAQSSTIVKTNASHTDTEDYANDDAIVEEDDDLNEPDEIYEFQENDEANKAKPETTLIRKNAVRLKPMTNIDQTKDQNGELSCHLCDYKTTKKFTLSRHMKSHTNEKPFKCFVCDRGFKTKTSIMNHVNTHLGKKPYACKDCPSSFTTTGELVRHTRYKHTGEKPHKCTECDYASVELSKLRRHIRCHTGERPYQCPHCTYASPDTFKLKRHMRTHTGEKPYECDICQARFTQSNSLKTHRLIHSVSDKPVFQCQFCPTTCGRKTDLRMHVLKIHNSDKPITCKRCGKELPDRYAYKLHVKTHQGEKCYRCKLCPYAAVLMRHLETHMLIHTDEKPFACEICQQRFRQRQLLRRHLNLYHNKDYVPPVPRAKEHGCPFCKRSFAHKGNLMRHMEVHDPNSNALKQKFDLKLGRKTRMQDVMPGSSNAADSMDGNQEEEDDEEAYDDPAYHEDYEEIDNENYELIEANDEEEGHNGVGGNYQEDNLDSGAFDGVEGGDLIESYVDIKPSVANIPKRNMSQQNATHDYESGGGLKTVNIKKESDGSEYISVAADDGQEYMILEVTQSDDEGGLDDVGVELVQNDNNDYTVMAAPVAANSVEYQPNRAKQLKHLVTINKVEHIPCQPIMPVKLEAAANTRATKIIEIKDVNQKVLQIIAIDE